MIRLNNLFDNTPQIYLHIQCNFYQNLRELFCRSQNLKFTQKSKGFRIAKESQEKKDKVGRLNTPDFKTYHTKLYSSRQSNTGIKTDIQINRKKQESKNKPLFYENIFQQKYQVLEWKKNKINLKTVNNYNNKCQGLSSGKRQHARTDGQFRQRWKS